METSVVWKRYSDDLKYFILSKVGKEEVAQDIIQEVFLKFHLHQNKIKKENSLKSWLFTVASSSIADYFRKKPKLSETLKIETPVENPETHSPEHCLQPLIKQLPEIYRKALVLSEIEGRKQKEVAQILEISLSGAKSRIQRGRKLLQKGYMDCCGYTLTEDGYLVGETKSLEECKICNS